MKTCQNIRHFMTKKALTTSVIDGITIEKMVSLHARIFNRRADPDRRGEHENHVTASSERTFDTYLTALNTGLSGAETREITHIQANFDFYNHGWTEMMEIPVDEIEAHHERYEEFFECHGIDIAGPPGEFRTIDIPDTSVAPDRLDDPDHPHAKSGFADDAYVKDDPGEVEVGGAGEPEDVGMSTAPRMQDVDRTDERIA